MPDNERDELVCPTCAAPLMEIVYGMPGPGLFEASDRGEVVIGGCVITGFDPTHQCRAGHQWVKANSRLGRLMVSDDGASGRPPAVAVDGWVAMGRSSDWRRDLSELFDD